MAVFIWARMMHIFCVIAIICNLAGASRIQFTRKAFAKLGSSLLLISQLSSPAMATTEFQEQLRVIEALQVQEQKNRIVSEGKAEVAEEKLLATTQYLVAKGIVSIDTAGTGVDPSKFPLGLVDAASLDPVFDNDKAALILTAVGRSGPPVAVKRYQLQSIQFPMLFEMTTDDLLFPYTPDAWLRSAMSKDSISVTCILETDGRLVTPSTSDRFGFAISSPITVDGNFQRTEAKVNINMKSDGRKYTEEELDLLNKLDAELDRKDQAKASVKPSR